MEVQILRSESVMDSWQKDQTQFVEILCPEIFTEIAKWSLAKD